MCDGSHCGDLYGSAAASANASSSSAGDDDGGNLFEDFGIQGEAFSRDWMESNVVWKFRVWHIMFLGLGAVMSLVILICCFIPFRIPRTKQEIEADSHRRKIANKFKKKLDMLSHKDLDELDLKKALEKIRAEFISDAESASNNDGIFTITNGKRTSVDGLSLDDFTVEKVKEKRKKSKSTAKPEEE